MSDVGGADEGAGAVVSVAADPSSASLSPPHHFLAPMVRSYHRAGSSLVHSGVAGPVVALGTGARAPAPAFANPGPLGLASYAGSTFLVSLAALRAGFSRPDVCLGVAYFFGGVTQVIAGQWEFASGNTFGATAFTGFGAFWLAYAYLLTPATGALAAYDGDAVGLRNALGAFWLTWTFFTWMITLAAHRTNLGLFVILLLTSISFPLLAAGAFSGVAGFTEAAGAVGLVAAAVAWYTATAGLLTPQTSRFTLFNPKL